MFVLLLLLGLGWAASISPAEIAAARQRCAEECNHAAANHVDTAACMRKCWAAFFADRKGQQRHSAAAAAAKITKNRHPAAVVPARAVDHNKKKKVSHKMVHPLVKGQHVKSPAKKKAPVAPFLHHRGRASMRSEAVQTAVTCSAVLILLVLVLL